MHSSTSGRVQLYPLTSTAHKGEMKTLVLGILHLSKFCLEACLSGLGPAK